MFGKEQDAMMKMMDRISVPARQLTPEESAAYTLIKAKAVELALLIEAIPVEFALAANAVEDPNFLKTANRATDMHVRMFAKTQEAQRAIVHLQDVMFRAQRAIDV